MKEHAVSFPWVLSGKRDEYIFLKLEKQSKHMKEKGKRMYQILVIEDDRALSDGIRLALRDLEHVIIQAGSLAQAEQSLFGGGEFTLVGKQIDLVILDLNLPDGNGLELLRKLRQKSELPVIILTANDMEIDIVTGLESGADDYITNPLVWQCFGQG